VPTERSRDVETAVRQKAVVKRGGVIEIRSPELPEGAVAEVIVLLETGGREALGWPEGFFERFAGSLPDFPDLESEGNYELREELT
jgi:hypothetical protein